MADEKKDLSDLKDLTETAKAETAAAETETEATAEGDTPTESEGTTLTEEAGTPVQTAPLREQELDEHGRAYATGRRKDAIARVWVKPGKGLITVNGKDQSKYFARPSLRLVINQPFDIGDRRGQYDVIATCTGGGLSGQAGAVKHGISQALSKYEPELRSVMKHAGFLTRDSRVVERKKYGKAKARKSFQFSKR